LIEDDGNLESSALQMDDVTQTQLH